MYICFKEAEYQVKINYSRATTINWLVVNYYINRQLSWLSINWVEYFVLNKKVKILLSFLNVNIFCFFSSSMRTDIVLKKIFWSINSSFYVTKSLFWQYFLLKRLTGFHQIGRNVLPHKNIMQDNQHLAAIRRSAALSYFRVGWSADLFTSIHAQSW